MKTPMLMVTAAHRYCLGRMTYMVEPCADWLVSICGELDAETQNAIRRDTAEAIKRGWAGMECDRYQWQWLLQETEDEAP